MGDCERLASDDSDDGEGHTAPWPHPPCCMPSVLQKLENSTPFPRLLQLVTQPYRKSCHKEHSCRLEFGTEFHGETAQGTHFAVQTVAERLGPGAGS